MKDYEPFFKKTRNFSEKMSFDEAVCGVEMLINVKCFYGVGRCFCVSL